MKIEKGRILEGFLFTPLIAYHWMNLYNGKLLCSIEIAFLLWRISFIYERNINKMNYGN